MRGHEHDASEPKAIAVLHGHRRSDLVITEPGPFLLPMSSTVTLSAATIRRA